jgi:hypothetical protein
MSTTYKTYNQLDDLIGEDRDMAFIGQDSRRHENTLEPGLVSYSQNMRFDKQTARPRKGVKRLSKGIKIASPPLVLPFTIPDFIDVESLSTSTSIATIETVSLHGYLVDQKVEVKSASIAGFNGVFDVVSVGSNLLTVNVGSSLGTENPTNAEIARRLVIKDVYEDGVFASEVFKDDSDDNEYICLATSSKAFFVDPDDADNPIEVDYTGSESIDSNDEVTLVQCLNKLVMLRGDAKEPLIFDGNLGSDLFEFVPSASISQDPLNSIPGTVSVSSGSTRVTGTDTNFREYLTIGQRIKIDGTYNFVASIFNDTILDTELASGVSSSSETLYRNIDRLSLIPMPNSEHGIYYQNRLILPYSAAGNQEFIISDILDIETFDAGRNQFKLLDGSADSLVGFSPYKEDQLIVFMKKSIHLLKNLSGSLEDVTAEEITSQIGCVSRGSIANIGNRVLFLSNSGVYSLEDGYEHKLRGYSDPVSKPIDDQIQEINFAAVENATSIYFNNRYYLAVPTGTNTSNNKVFVWNFLNNAWESTDVYPSAVEISKFHIADFEGTQRLFAVGFTGQLILLDEGTVDEYGTLGDELTSSADISGQIVTRGYILGDTGIKRYKRSNINANMSDGETINVTAITKSPDQELSVLSETHTGVDSEKMLRPSLKTLRGYTLQLQVDTTGRPDIRSITTEGSVTFRETQTFE